MDFDGVQWRVGQLHFLQGQREDSVVYHFNDGYFYHKHHDADRPESAFITLRCIKRRSATTPCVGAAVASRDGAYFQVTRRHSHAADLWSVEERQLRRSLIQAVATGDPRPYSVIIRNVGMRGGFSLEARSRLTVARMRTAMRDERIRWLPPVPQTLTEMAGYLQDPQYHHVATTIDQQDSIFAGSCGDFASGTFSVVFMSQRQGTCLQQSSRSYIDGTFRKRPKKPESSQILVISRVWYNEHSTTKLIITCVRVLMQGRTTQAYVALFSFLRQLLPGWYPTTFNTDHEKALVAALNLVFPAALIVTCLFHFSSSVFTNAKEIGLKQIMEQSRVVDSVVRACAVLPLLPADHILYGMHALGHWARIMGAMQHPLVRQFFLYLHREWTPTIWYLSVFNQEDRTDNVSEAAHSSLGVEVPEDHPNAWCLLGAFKRLEDQCMVHLYGLRQGRQMSRTQQLRTLRNDHRIRNLEDSYMRGNIDVVTFLREASASNQAPYDIIFH